MGGRRVGRATLRAGPLTSLTNVPQRLIWQPPAHVAIRLHKRLLLQHVGWEILLLRAQAPRNLKFEDLPRHHTNMGNCTEPTNLPCRPSH